MLAQNKAEEDARREESMLNTLTSAFNRHPDVSAATNVGDPSLQDRDLIDPGKLVRENMAGATKPPSGTKSINVEKTNTEAPGANQPAPRSDEPAADNSSATTETNTPDTQQAAPPDPNELKPTPSATNSDPQPVASNDPNELKPNVAPQDPAPAQAPAQVNEVQGGGATQAAQNGNSDPAAAQQPATDSEIAASSKHKKKKGLSKIIPGK
jgi:hypothetical protein